MRAIRNFLHNINDVVLAIIIVALAAGIIYWRMQIILDYPKQIVEEQSVQTEEQAGEAASDAVTTEDSVDQGSETDAKEEEYDAGEDGADSAGTEGSGEAQSDEAAAEGEQ